MTNFCDSSGNYFKNKPFWCIGDYDIIATLIITTAVILAITSVWNDSPIVDEIPHIGAGYSYIATGDHRLNPEHPPLAKDLAGLSLKIGGINDKAAFESRFWKEDLNGQWEFGKKLIFDSGNDANRLVRFAKMPELIFFVLSAIIIFIWTRKLFGYLAGLIALFLFSFSPTVIAHSRFVTTDVPALFGILFATFFFVHYLENQNRKNLWLAGLVFGVAELTKYSVFLLAPFFIVVAVLYGLLKIEKSKLLNTFYLLLSAIFIIAIGYLFVVWPVYYFHTWNYPPELQQSQTREILESYGNRYIAETVIYLSDKPVFKGIAEYALGLLMVTQRSIGGNTTYFMGEIRNWAWPHYFPVVYFIKEPLPFWGMLILVWLVFSARIKTFYPKQVIYNILNWSREHFTELVMFLWIGLYWYVSIRANLNIGVRHMMPVYGFTFILLAGALVRICGFINSKKLLTAYCILLATLFSWYLFENLSVYPYYLTYFNQVAGGPSGGYRYVVDSNLDWGQDLKRLAKWVDENKIEKIYFDYFGWANPVFYLQNKYVGLSAGKYNSAREFLNDNPNGGYIAISVSFYMGSRENPQTSYAWLENYEKATVIGNSIFVWHIRP